MGCPSPQAARAFGDRRQAFYEVAAALDAGGPGALAAGKPGPKGPLKLTDRVMDEVEGSAQAADLDPRSRDLADRAQDVFGFPVHPRSVECALARRRRPADFPWSPKPGPDPGPEAGVEHDQRLREAAGSPQHGLAVLAAKGLVVLPRVTTALVLAAQRQYNSLVVDRAAESGGAWWTRRSSSLVPDGPRACPLDPDESSTGEDMDEQLFGPALKVTADHLSRDAYLYVRQSSIKQVLNNTESTVRQYESPQPGGRAGLAGADRIIVIDTDQGQSGASATDREGFQHLVTEVGMGRAGIVLGLEVSRLARNNTDWHRLLEICAMSGTLILDEDGLDDPCDFNDRLLVGLKRGPCRKNSSTCSKARLRGGQLSKARRG